jgi:hypothetical protein
MDTQVSQCPTCFTKGYELQENGRCHLCNDREQKRKILIDDLQAILDMHMNDSTRWAGAEFGKAAVGNAIIEAIQSHGGTPVLLTTSHQEL